jgi:hypothetical protein
VHDPPLWHCPGTRTLLSVLRSVGLQRNASAGGPLVLTLGLVAGRPAAAVACCWWAMPRQLWASACSAGSPSCSLARRNRSYASMARASSCDARLNIVGHTSFARRVNTRYFSQGVYRFSMLKARRVHQTGGRGHVCPPWAHCLPSEAIKRSLLLQCEGNDGDFASSENRVLLLHKAIALHNKHSKDATNWTRCQSPCGKAAGDAANRRYDRPV